MSRPNPIGLFLFLLGILALLGGAAALKGGFYLGKHEGDTLHLLQIVFRMTAGEVPHLDFMTPIGAFAFAPIALLVDQGMGIGNAIIWSQILVASAMLPAIWWTCYSRMNKVIGALFGLVVLVLILALVHGESQRSVSISMHYNRWAWAASYLAIALSILPTRGRNVPVIDGVIIGAMMSCLVMIKITYFAAFAIPVILGLILRGNFKSLVVSIVTGLLIMGAITLYVGPSYWPAYLADLLEVAGSQVRSAPGEPFGAVVGAPAYLGGSLVALLGVIFLRQAKEQVGGLVLLLLVPGFFYVTFQNYGNDPQWLLLLAVLLVALRPTEDVVNGWGWNMRNTVNLTAAAAVAFALPSFFNLAYSPLRHFNVGTEKFVPMLPRATVHSDLQTAGLRANRVDGRIALDGEGTGLEPYFELAKREDIATFQGEEIRQCSIELGMPAWFDTIVQDLEEQGLAKGKRLFAADLFSSHWLYGELEPLIGGAPWYYGGLPGFDSADYLLVPICAVTPEVRKQILDTITEADAYSFTEIRRTPLYILYEKTNL